MELRRHDRVPDSCRLTILSFKIECLSWFYTYGWFTGSILGGLIYYLVAQGERSGAEHERSH